MVVLELIQGVGAILLKEHSGSQGDFGNEGMGSIQWISFGVQWICFGMAVLTRDGGEPCEYSNRWCELGEV